MKEKYFQLHEVPWETGSLSADHWIHHVSEPEDSLLRSQQPTTERNPEPADSGPRPDRLFIQGPF